MKALWHWQELLQAVNGVATTPGEEVTGVSIDSRSVVAGDLFIALSGKPAKGFTGGSENFRDGHDFVAAAAEAGASAALVNRRLPVDIPQIVVADTFAALWQLGEAGRARLAADAKVIAITGSAGKTTLRSWLQEVLPGYASVHASVGSYNNHWGVPLSLSRMPRDVSLGVFEVGTNHPGEIAPLSKLVRPDVSVLLNVLPAHLGNFPDMSALRHEKLSIAAGLQPGGKLVVLDTVVADQVAEHMVTFGFTGKASVRGEVSSGRLTVDVGGQSMSWSIPAGFGEHRLQTVLAILAVLSALELDPANVTDLLMGLGSPKGRGNQVQVNGITVIDDSYNANPVSTRYALAALIDGEARRRVVLLGEMLELGDSGVEMHQSLLPLLHDVDELYTFGEGLAGIASHCSGFKGHYASAADFDLEQFVQQRQKGDVVLIKGSNKVFWTHGFVDKLAVQLHRQSP